MHPAAAFLVRVGTIGAMVEGGRILYRGVSKMTEGTTAGNILAGVGDTVSNVLDPFHIFTPDPANQRDKEKAAKKKAQKEAKKQAAAKKKARAQAEAAEAQASEADARASTLEQQVAEANARAQSAEQRAVTAEKAVKARSMRRFATLSRTTAAAAKSTPDPLEAAKLAIQAFQLGMSAKNPPVDPRQALTSSMSEQTKSLVTDIIDSINREQEPSYEALVERIRGGDDSAYDDLLDTADSFSGHDHDHGNGRPCCESCAKGGPCTTCTGKAPRSLADIPTNMLYGPDGGDVVAGVGLSEEDLADLDSYGVVPDYSANADRLIREMASCNTGTCKVR